MIYIVGPRGGRHLAAGLDDGLDDSRSGTTRAAQLAAADDDVDDVLLFSLCMEPQCVMLLLAAVAGAARAASGSESSVPSLAALSPPAFITIETCPPTTAPRSSSASSCPGWALPQKDGMVKGDNATMCFHLGCCYSLDKATGRDSCHAATPATAKLAATSEWLSGNQPLPSLSNTRGTVQLPLETADALSVDCIYFPPMFGTCDGSRSDSRFDRNRDPTGPVSKQPTFGGATQNLQVNGAPLVSTAFKWTPAELVRRASAAGLPWLLANTSVRMVLAQSQIMLTLTLRNAAKTPQPLNVSFEIPFVSRLYAEVESGYEGSSPTPLPAGPQARNTNDWKFTRRSATAAGGVALQTAQDTAAANSQWPHQHPAGIACTAATVAAGSGLSPVQLTDVSATGSSTGGWSRALTAGVLLPGGSATIQIVLSVAPTCAVARTAATGLAATFDTNWAAIPTEYEDRWQDAFVPHSHAHFSGNWPVLETDDAALARTYYGSLMSMLLVNKQGIDTDMVIEEQHNPTAAKAAGGCEGTYMPTSAGKNQPPLQLHGAHNGQVTASQFAGRTSARWSSGTGEISGNELTMTFDGSSAARKGTIRKGTIAKDCARIEWAAGPDPEQAPPSTWVRIRPAGRWNLFIAAGALLGNTAFYLWDTSGASLLWTLLDPDGMAVANDVFATADPLLKNACDYISMAESGKYYAFSAISEFQSIANEVRIGGEAVAKRVIPMTNRTLIEQLVFVAQEYKRLPKLGPDTDLPDWGGGSTHFLECQDSYQHGVAGLQASQVWMLTEAATLLRATGGSEADAAEMESSAKTLLGQMLPQLSQDPTSGGWWHALSPVCADGTHCRTVDDCKCNGTSVPDSVEVRMIHDFLYIGQTIAANLTSVERTLMTNFFNRELRTPDFVRAMSQDDPSANVTGSRRSDHNQWGSWDGWAGGSITALAELGDMAGALEFTQALSHNLDEGPFGQAHRVFGAGTGATGEMARPARKDQSWMAVCSGCKRPGKHPCALRTHILSAFMWVLRAVALCVLGLQTSPTASSEGCSASCLPSRQTTASLR